MSKVDAPPSVRHCRVCGEEINFEARKCRYCGSYLDYRRIFNISPLVLSLIATVVSVCSIAAPPILGLFTPNDSKLLFSVLRVNDRAVSVFVSNVGTRPGVVGTVAIVELGDSKGHSRIYSAETFGDSDIDIVPAGMSLLVDFPMGAAKIKRDFSTRKCFMTFSETTFRGEDLFPRSTFNCIKVPYINGGLGLGPKKRK